MKQNILRPELVTWDILIMANLVCNIIMFSLKNFLFFSNRFQFQTDLCKKRSPSLNSKLKTKLSFLDHQSKIRIYLQQFTRNTEVRTPY